MAWRGSRHQSRDRTGGSRPRRSADNDVARSGVDVRLGRSAGRSAARSVARARRRAGARLGTVAGVGARARTAATAAAAAAAADRIAVNIARSTSGSRARRARTGARSRPSIHDDRNAAGLASTFAGEAGGDDVGSLRLGGMLDLNLGGELGGDERCVGRLDGLVDRVDDGGVVDASVIGLDRAGGRVLVAGDGRDGAEPHEGGDESCRTHSERGVPEGRLVLR